jgi:hypothetical protein
MVVSPNRWNMEVPREPVTDLCGIAVQNGMALKYLIVSASEAHLETNTMAKSLLTVPKRIKQREKWTTVPT